MKVSAMKTHSMILKELLDAKINGTLANPNDLIVYHPNYTSAPKTNISILVIYANGLLSSQFARDRKGYDLIGSATVDQFFNILKTFGHWATSEAAGYGQLNENEDGESINWALTSLDFMQRKDAGYEADLKTWMKYTV